MAVQFSASSSTALTLTRPLLALCEPCLNRTFGTRARSHF